MPILFIGIILVAVFLFIKKIRVISILIFFFFLTDGFQIIPNTIKGENSLMVYASIYMLLLSVISLFNKKKYQNKSVLYSLYIYLVFLLVILGVNILVYHVPLSDIIQNGHQYALILSFFVFKQLDNDEISEIKYIMFVITLFFSFLFIIQVFTGQRLLTGFIGGTIDLGIISFKRCYSWPSQLLYFTFHAYFCNPFQGKAKTISIIILTTAFLLPMHRAFILCFFVILIFGLYKTTKDKKQFIKYLGVIIGVTLLISTFLIQRFASTSDSVGGITSLFKDIETFDYSLSSDQTMYYRMGHTIERFLFATSDIRYSVFGFGFWGDENPNALEKVDFLIYGLDENFEQNIPFSTTDIAWSLFFIRLGIIGTILFLIFYFKLFGYFYKRIDSNKLAIVNVTLLLLLFATSITCIELITLHMYIFTFMDFCYIENNNLANNNKLSDTPTPVT